MAKKGVNKATVMGFVGKDPEVRYTANGDAVTSVSVATSETWTDKTSGEVKEATEWHRIIFYRRLAEIVGDYVSKGAKIYVEGKLKTRKWTDQQGIERYTTEIHADELQIAAFANDDDAPQQQAPQRQAPQQRQQTPQQQAPRQNKRQAPQQESMYEGGGDFDDDIPFNRLQHEYIF